jgi:hypothetical protein
MVGVMLSCRVGVSVARLCGVVWCIVLCCTYSPLASWLTSPKSPECPYTEQEDVKKALMLTYKQRAEQRQEMDQIRKDLEVRVLLFVRSFVCSFVRRVRCVCMIMAGKERGRGVCWGGGLLVDDDAVAPFSQPTLARHTRTHGTQQNKPIEESLQRLNEIHKNVSPFATALPCLALPRPDLRSNPAHGPPAQTFPLPPPPTNPHTHCPPTQIRLGTPASC